MSKQPSFEDVTHLVRCIGNVQTLVFGLTVSVERQAKGWVALVRRRNGNHYYDFGSDTKGDTVYERNVKDMSVNVYTDSLAEAIKAGELLEEQHG